jgi:hypothetical protein
MVVFFLCQDRELEVGLRLLLIMGLIVLVLGVKKVVGQQVVVEDVVRVKNGLFIFRKKKFWGG